METLPKYRQFGEHAIEIRWPARINEATNDAVLQMDYFITENFKEQIIETVPAYHSLVVYLREKILVSEFISSVKEANNTAERRIPKTKSLVTIPVCYEDKYAIDMQYVASTHKLTPSEIIRIHTQPKYKVYFLGFLPGFPYLGGLDKRLVTPRKSTPRSYIACGSVAIGGGQTGIYTFDSPGGWNIIGKSPLQFFSTERSSLSLLRPGDFLKFESVTRSKYKKIRGEVVKGDYKIAREVYRD